MKLGFGPKYFLKCVLTDSVNNSILKKNRLWPQLTRSCHKFTNLKTNFEHARAALRHDGHSGKFYYCITYNSV